MKLKLKLVGTFVASGMGDLDVHVYFWLLGMLMPAIGVSSLLAEGKRIIYTWSHDTSEWVPLRDLDSVVGRYPRMAGKRWDLGVRLTYSGGRVKAKTTQPCGVGRIKCMENFRWRDRWSFEFI